MSFMSAAIIGGAASLGAAGIGAWSSMAASGQQTAALQSAQAQQMNLFKQAKAGLQPFMTNASNVYPTLQKFTQPGPDMTNTLSQLPGFQFAQDWGQKAVQNLGTTTGLGGNTLTAGANFATGLAQQSWKDYLGPLLNIYNTGAGAAGSLAGTAGTFAGPSASLGSQVGQAQAAGTLGAANAFGGGLQGGANAFGNYSLLSKLFGGANSPGGTSGPGGIYGNTDLTNQQAFDMVRGPQYG